MSKTICFFSAQYLPHLGGVERYTYNLSKKLINLGYKVIIVTSQMDQLPHEEFVENMKIYRMDSYPLMGDRLQIKKRSKKNKEIEEKLLASNIDQVIVNTRFYSLSLFGLKLAKQNKIPSFLIEHSTGHIEFNNKLIGSIGQLYDHWMTKQIKKQCNNFYGVSEACNKWLQHFKIQANGTLYNAIDIDNIKEIQKDINSQYRNMYNITKDDIVICFTGRLIEEKGILELIEAVKQITIKNNKVHLFVAGDGPLYDKIKKEKIPNIFVLGKIDFQEVITLLSESDIFCFPTNYPEGFSTSVLEAAACHCFIITTDRGGSKELIVSNDYGIILQDGKKEYIEAALNEVINNIKQTELITKKAYSKLIDNFIWDRTAERVHQITLSNTKRR